MPFSGGDAQAGLISIVYGGQIRPVLGSALGDSYTAYNLFNGSPKSRGYYPHGYVSEARVQSGQRFTIPVEYFKGVGGESIVQIAARVGDILALNPRPQFCAVYGGINPSGTNDILSYGTIIKTLSEAGILPIIMAVIPKGSNNAGQGAHQKDINARLRGAFLGNKYQMDLMGIGPQHAFAFYDPNRFLTDFSSATGEPIAGVLVDGLHLNPTGAFFCGRELANTISAIYGTLPVPLGGDVLDTYIAGAPGAVNTASFGNLVPSTLGVMLGTGGSVVADISTGVTLTNNGLATNLLYRRFTGNSTVNVTLSKVAKADGVPSGTRQRIDISGLTPAATSPQGLEQYRFYTSFPASSVAVGDYVFAEIDAEILTASTNLRSMELTIDPNSGGACDGRQTGANMPAFPQRRILRTPPLLIDAAAAKTVDFSVWVDATITNAPPLSIAFDRFQVRKCGPLG